MQSREHLVDLAHFAGIAARQNDIFCHNFVETADERR
jgi:hypothetical protein